MVTPESGAATFFKSDHRACDDAWAALEEATGGPDRTRLLPLWKDFSLRMERHLAMEEEVLFPAFEKATGMHGTGPTEMMRHEHRQMRALLQDMARRAAADDFDGVLDQGDTLLMLVQQHNAKEEGMLYPMAEKVLAAAWAGIAAGLRPYLDRPSA
jgi:iron-sulfur cluster repair protein YtfE (RIC family)